jgi:hypothetical protein|tara:strand:+ start:1060 stop:1437 length:378 start_codon:yes stop_codon:yes gene_type:complete
MDNNNNKRKNDGRKTNKRQDRVKIIKNNTGTVPMVNKAKKNRAKALSKKAINNIFSSEDGVWESLATMAAEGNMKAMEMLLTYQYGKAGEAKEQRAVANKAPIIQFNVQNPEKTEKIIDITDEEE